MSKPTKPYFIICPDCEENVALEFDTEEELQRVVDSQDQEGSTTDYLCQSCWDEQGGADKLSPEDETHLRKLYREYTRLMRQRNRKPLSFQRWCNLG